MRSTDVSHIGQDSPVPRHSLRLAAVFLAALVLVSCGGASSDNGAGADGAATTSANGSGGADANTDTTSGANGTPAVEHATIEFDGDLYEFDDASACIVDADRIPPVLASFGDELGTDPEVDRLVVGRASNDIRIFVDLGESRWDVRLKEPPDVSGTTATWDSIELGRVDEEGSDVMTITVTCG